MGKALFVVYQQLFNKGTNLFSMFIMKKQILSTLVISLVSILAFSPFAFAQQYGWEKKVMEGDELLGRKGRTFFVSQNNHDEGFIFFPENYKNEPFVSVTSTSILVGNKGSYAYKQVIKEDNAGIVSVLVGYYIDERLVDKETLEGVVGLHNPSVIVLPSEKIIEHLLYKGGVRFYVYYNGGGQLDLSVPRVRFAPDGRSLQN